MEELERIQATNSQAAAMVAQYQLSETPRGRGSRPHRAPNVERHREVRGRNGRPTIILEAVASYDTHIWHAFFGTPGAQNDLNVLGASNVFERVIGGTAPLVEFEVNNKRYTNGYYLADGIYPRWSTFVKTISNPEQKRINTFVKNKRLTAKMWKGVLDEEEFAEPEEDDLMNPAMATVYDWPVHPNNGEAIPFEPVGRDGQNLPSFMDREFQVESANLHKCLQDDLVMHNWNMDGN
ncbi:uncharacterized protein LOC112199224 [Rosa chinensis]|uniref:uncharacterized protein LOC112199224 n=1 Tax=Rosa chinensis TaxID=74649 RepID=UPI000D0933B7|nr:uncharacterized protein LOC112199224 [Rosa chinensis]